MKKLAILITAVLIAGYASAQEKTYAEKLGWPAGTKALIFHVDDAGMSHDSNLGTIEAMEKGVATSTSIMFPCPWVSEYAHYLKDHPDKDAGVHLTLTSEWDVYRWGPVAGKNAVPGCADEQWCLWDNVPLVVQHASADEVDKEIRAQLDKCLTMGITPTHLDSHMGTLFSKPEYIERYIKLGIEKKIPILMPGGHMTYVKQDEADAAAGAKAAAEMVWNGGLPVIDDIYTAPYGQVKFDEKKAKTLEFIKTLKPGITEVIIHCTRPSESFKFISPSGETRLNDLLLVLDPDVKKAIEDQKIVLTTWRELKQRRDQVK